MMKEREDVLPTQYENKEQLMVMLMAMKSRERSWDLNMKDGGAAGESCASGCEKAARQG